VCVSTHHAAGILPNHRATLEERFAQEEILIRCFNVRKR
jgi:hypothetical protein